MEVTIWSEAPWCQRAAESSSANMRAGTRVNVEQASKLAMRGPTNLRNGEGRRRRGKRVVICVPLRHGFRSREVENLSGAGFRVASVGKPRKHTGGFVNEWQGFSIVDPFEFGSSIIAGLRFDGRDIVTPVLRLGLDNTDGLLSNKENVVGWPNVRLILTDGDTRGPR